MKEIFPKNTDNIPTLDDLLKSIGADFEAVQQPIFKLEEDGSYSAISGYSTIVNSVNKAPLSVMSARYGLSQYKDTLAFLDDLVGQGAATLWSATMTDNGAKLHVAIKAPNSVVFAPGDEFECFYTASSSHDGSISIQFMASPVHKKTQTILPSLDNGIIKIRHTARVKDRLARAQSIIRKMQDTWLQHSDSFKKFAGVPLTDIEAQTYFEMLVPSDAEEVATRTKNVREKLFDIYKVGVAANLPSCKDTLLGAFVAALVFGDYYKTVRESITGRSDRDARIESRLTGSAARFKADSFAYAVKLMK